MTLMIIVLEFEGWKKKIEKGMLLIHQNVDLSILNTFDENIFAIAHFCIG